MKNKKTLITVIASFIAGAALYGLFLYLSAPSEEEIQAKKIDEALKVLTSRKSPKKLEPMEF